MAKFCTDVDLLKWEPGLFGALGRMSQVLCQGEEGISNGVLFSSAGADFISSGVSAG